MGNLLRKDIRKEVRADGTEYYFVQFVYEKTSIIRHLFSKNDVQISEKIVEDAIPFHTLKRAQEYANIVDAPSELGWSRTFSSNRMVCPTVKNEYSFSLSDSTTFAMYFIHPWNEKLIDKNRTDNNCYSKNINYMYFFYSDFMSGYVIMDNANWKFFDEEYSKKEHRIEDFLAGCDYENCVIFRNKTGNILFKDPYSWRKKFFETPYDLLKDVLGSKYRTREEEIEYRNLQAIKERKHKTVVSNEIVSTSTNLMTFEELEDEEDAALLEKRNKLIEAELKRIDDYKETLKSLIR